jgi:hypothetical protein
VAGRVSSDRHTPVCRWLEQCDAESKGVEYARASMENTGYDARLCMMPLVELFKGHGTVDEVGAARQT